MVLVLPLLEVQKERCSPSCMPYNLAGTHSPISRITNDLRGQGGIKEVNALGPISIDSRFIDENGTLLPRFFLVLQVELLRLDIAMAQYLSTNEALDLVEKDASPVYYTRNFFASNERLDSGFLGQPNNWLRLDDYLRPVDALLVFPSREVLLLSERETDGILRVMRDARHPRLGYPKLLHVSYLRSSRDEAVSQNPLLSAAATEARVWQRVTNSALANLWVFAGTTAIPQEDHEAVQALVKGRRSKVLRLLEMRGVEQMMPRSILERLLRA